MVHDRFTVEVGDLETLKASHPRAPPGGPGLRRLPGHAGLLAVPRGGTAGARVRPSHLLRCLADGLARPRRPRQPPSSASSPRWASSSWPSGRVVRSGGSRSGSPVRARRRPRRRCSASPSSRRARRSAPGTPSLERQLRMVGAIVLVALVIVLAIGGIWYLFVRGDGGLRRDRPGAGRGHHHDVDDRHRAPTRRIRSTARWCPATCRRWTTRASTRSPCSTRAASRASRARWSRPRSRTRASRCPPRWSPTRPTAPPTGHSPWSCGPRATSASPGTWPRSSASSARRRSTATRPTQVGNADAVVLVGKDLAPAGTATP